MLRPLALPALTLVLACSCLAGCAGYGHVRFQPNPLDVRLARGTDAATLALALVSVRGIEEAAGGQGAWELHVRLHLANEADTDLVLVPEESELLDGALETFPTPRVRRRESSEAPPVQGDPFRLAPGAAGAFDLVFPFPANRPPDELDLSGLSLRWTVEVDGARMRVSSTFERVRRSYPDDPYYPYYYGCHPWLGFHSHYHRFGHPHHI